MIFRLVYSLCNISHALYLQKQVLWEQKCRILSKWHPSPRLCGAITTLIIKYNTSRLQLWSVLTQIANQVIIPTAPDIPLKQSRKWRATMLIHPIADTVAQQIFTWEKTGNLWRMKRKCWKSECRILINKRRWKAIKCSAMLGEIQ